MTRLGNESPGLDSTDSRHLTRLQQRYVRLNFFAVFVVEAEKLDPESQTLPDIGDPGDGDHAVLIGQLEAHDHSCAGAYRFFSFDKQAADADVTHVFPDARRTAATVGKLEFDLGAYGGTLEPSSLKLR
jgi:hypothetical protein